MVKICVYFAPVKLQKADVSYVDWVSAQIDRNVKALFRTNIYYFLGNLRDWSDERNAKMYILPAPLVYLSS